MSFERRIARRGFGRADRASARAEAEAVLEADPRLGGGGGRRQRPAAASSEECRRPHFGSCPSSSRPRPLPRRRPAQRLLSPPLATGSSISAGAASVTSMYRTRSPRLSRDERPEHGGRSPSAGPARSRDRAPEAAAAGRRRRRIGRRRRAAGRRRRRGGGGGGGGGGGARRRRGGADAGVDVAQIDARNRRCRWCRRPCRNRPARRRRRRW